MDTKYFCTYEQSLALKKLGFKEECLYYYDIVCKDEILPNVYYIDDESTNIDDLFESHNEEDCDDICSAPTLFQAQMWLEKQKGLVICTSPEAKFERNNEEPKNSKWIHTGYVHNIFKITQDKELLNATDENSELYLSSEEALSNGIDVCIKLCEQ